MISNPDAPIQFIDRGADDFQIRFHDRAHTPEEWAEILQLASESSLRSRVVQSGWTLEDALTYKKKRSNKTITPNQLESYLKRTNLRIRDLEYENMIMRQILNIPENRGFLLSKTILELSEAHMDPYLKEFVEDWGVAKGINNPVYRAIRDNGSAMQPYGDKVLKKIAEANRELLRELDLPEEGKEHLKNSKMYIQTIRDQEDKRKRLTASEFKDPPKKVKRKRGRPRRKWGAITDDD